MSLLLEKVCASIVLTPESGCLPRPRRKLRRAERYGLANQSPPHQLVAERRARGLSRTRNATGPGRVARVARPPTVGSLHSALAPRPRVEVRSSRVSSHSASTSSLVRGERTSSRTRSWGVGLALPLKRQMAAFAVGAFASAARARPAPRRRASEPRFAKPRAAVVVRAGESSISEKLELTADNVEKVLDEVRPYLIADGGDVELVEIDGLVVRLKLNGACGSCPSSTTTMRMGIEKD